MFVGVPETAQISQGGEGAAGDPQGGVVQIKKKRKKKLRSLESSFATLIRKRWRCKMNDSRMKLK